nr:MAG TPA: Replication initiation and membrane attachment [Caudoviricetes sp.]
MKKGLDFFPLDVDFFDDEKVQFVSARFGIKGEVCAIRLLTRIYRNGYFIKWDEDSAYLFSKVAGKEFSPCLANEIVHELVKRGFFNKSLFDSFGILTSRGIQDRFLKACIRRKDVEVDARYLLVDSSEFKNLRISKAYSSAPSFRKCIHDVSISEENVYIKEENVDIQAQSKVKESRVEESKEEERISAAADEIMGYYSSNIHPVSSLVEKDKLIALVETHGEAFVHKAIERAVMRNKRSLAYITGILNNWEANGYDEGTEGKRTEKQSDPERSADLERFMREREEHKKKQRRF